MSLPNKNSSNDLLIDFPEVRQTTDYSCGASALQAILYYYGLSYREDQLIEILRSNHNAGTPPSNIVTYCRKLGFIVIEKQHMTIDDIRYYLKQKIPILVAYQVSGASNTCQNGHYSVIIGLQGDKLIFDDPAIIGKGFIRIADFFRRWYDCDIYGQQYVRYGIMIYGARIKYNSKKLTLL